MVYSVMRCLRCVVTYLTFSTIVSHSRLIASVVPVEMMDTVVYDMFIIYIESYISHFYTSLPRLSMLMPSLATIALTFDV